MVDTKDNFQTFFQNPLDKIKTMRYNDTKQNDWRRNYEIN